MSEEILGKVLEKADLDSFQFVSTKYFHNRFIKVKMNHIGEDTKIIGEVISIESVNPYFEKPTIIRYVEEQDESIALQSLYIAKVRPIALIQDGQFKDIDFPPSPGTNVIKADEADVSRALGLEGDGISIGNLKGSINLHVKLSPDKLFRTHFSILGRTGSGKSYFAKGLAKRIFAERKLVIISPTEEYDELLNELPCKVIASSEMSLPLKPSYLASIYGLTLQEQILFEKFLNDWKENLIISNQKIAKEFKNWLLQTEGKRSKGQQSQLFPSTGKELPKYGDTILSKIRTKKLYFSNSPLKVPFEDSVVLNMTDLPQESQENIVTYVLNNILESYNKKGDSQKLLVIIEEAHNFAPSVQTTACKEKIVQLAREGRKLGINLCLISQRPRHLDQTVLSQAGSLFLFNIPHPDDIEHVFGISPIYSSEMSNAVRRLKVGECLIIGDVMKYPIVCKVAF